MEYNQKALSYLMKTAINYGGTNYHVAMLIFQLFLAESLGAFFVDILYGQFNKYCANSADKLRM